MTLSKLRISALTYWNNTFGAGGLNDFLNFFFLVEIFLWFGRKKLIDSYGSSWIELLHYSVLRISASCGVKKILGAGGSVRSLIPHSREIVPTTVEFMVVRFGICTFREVTICRNETSDNL